MAALPLVPEIKKDLNIEQRIELVLDLTCRVELLDELLRAAREKRRVTDTAVSLVDMEQDEFDAISV